MTNIEIYEKLKKEALQKCDSVFEAVAIVKEEMKKLSLIEASNQEMPHNNW